MYFADDECGPQPLKRDDLMMLSEESLDYEGGQKQEEETKVQKDN